MHACDWASKPPAAAAAARGATPGFPSLASLCAPSSSVPSSSLPHDTSASSSLQRTIPHLQSARGGTLMGMAIHRAQSREARGLHQSPHGQRPVAPRAARRHRNAPPHARMAERGRVLDPARAPHAGVVGAARAQGGGAGVGVGTACCKMLCVTAGVDLCYDCAGGLMPGGC